MDADAGNGAAFDRHIVLESAVNFRDLGGYGTTDGRAVRWRSLFRADGLSNLTPLDQARLRELGIATVIDLRSAAELGLGRFPVEDIPVGFHHLPLIAELPDLEQFRLAPGFLASQYREIARESGARIAQALSIVAEPQTHPVVVHCAAGKDRTGVLAAVILSLLGVDDQTIADDYALSTGAMAQLRERMVASNPDQREIIEAVGDVVFTATPTNITTLLQVLRDEHGSVEAYAEAHGAGADVVAGLQAALLE